MINKQWHDKHHMPAKATMDQRIEWHIDHSRNCQCRPVPDSVMKEIKKRKLKF